MSLQFVNLGDLDDRTLDIGKCVEWDVVDLVLDAVFLQFKASASEKYVGFPCCGECSTTSSGKK